VRSLVLALHFLTVVRLPAAEAAGPGALGRAGWWFPAVGLGLGAALAGVDHLARLAWPPLVAAAVVVVAWKALTGALHLDGLADCLDGLAGRSPAERLGMMRDSRLGAYGGVGVALALGLAAALVAELPPAARLPALVLAPAAGRLAPLLLASAFGPATPGEGMGAAFLAGLPRAAGPVELGALALGAGVALGPAGLVALAAAAAAALAWGGVFARRLGGLSGDVLGGSVEVAELAALLGLLAAPGWSA
jgi:adenosylcobinamide-GDP ribazoletransferase